MGGKSSLTLSSMQNKSSFLYYLLLCYLQKNTVNLLLPAPVDTHTHTLHIFIISSSVDGHLGYCHILAISTNAAMNPGGHISCQISLFGFLNRYPEEKLTDHIAALVLII